MPKTSAKKKTGNPVSIRIVGPVQIRIGSGALAVMHIFTPYNCTCPDQTFQDLPDELHLCKHIRRVLTRSAALIRAGQRVFQVPSDTENGVVYTVTLVDCTCGHDQFESLCPAGTIFFEELAGRRAPGGFGTAA